MTRIERWDADTLLDRAQQIRNVFVVLAESQSFEVLAETLVTQPKCLWGPDYVLVEDNKVPAHLLVTFRLVRLWVQRLVDAHFTVEEIADGASCFCGWAHIEPQPSRPPMLGSVRVDRRQFPKESSKLPKGRKWPQRGRPDDEVDGGGLAESASSGAGSGSTDGCGAGTENDGTQAATRC